MGVGAFVEGLFRGKNTLEKVKELLEKVVMKANFSGQVICVLRSPTEGLAYDMAEVCIETGLKNIEVTFTIPKAEVVIKKLKSKYPEAVIGCGSVGDLSQARKARDNGADFFVSPHFDKELAQWFSNENLFYIPGGLTPSELFHIFKTGHVYQNLFPGEVFGPSGVKGLLRPMPFLKLLVTGGVDLKTSREFLDAGAEYVCVGSQLFSKSIIKEKNLKSLSKKCQEWLKVNSYEPSISR